MGPEEMIAAYQLERHPEGGWFREVHRSSRLHQVPGYPGARTAFTAIYFLLARGDFSAFHRLRSEEVWIHLAGDPLELVLMGREVRRITLGPVTHGGDPVAVVLAGELQAGDLPAITPLWLVSWRRGLSSKIFLCLRGPSCCGITRSNGS